jgi:competence protein ComEA
MLRIGVSLLALLACLAAHPFAQQAEPTGKAATRAAKPAAVVNINTASVAELDQLPGIGPAVAARIVDYRTKKGPFRKLEELMNVQGIGEKSFLKLRSQLTIAGSAAPAAQQQ